jgi:hypothetical protein
MKATRGEPGRFILPPFGYAGKRRDPALGRVRPGWAVFFTAGGVLGFEIALMRVLLVASWHHFAFLVISVVLLGFGASGTALAVLRPWLVRRYESVLFGLVLATALSMPVCAGLAQYVPIAARFVPALAGRQIGSWVLYWALLGIPFFLGAGVIGLSLMAAGRRVPRVYAGNLLGSAVGAGVATLAMHAVPPPWLAPLMGAIVLLGSVGLRAGPPVARNLARLAVIAAAAAYLLIDPPHIRVDPYKYGAYAAQLERQGRAVRVDAAYGPRAWAEVYRGDVFHDLPFLSGDEAPPPLAVLLADGHHAGSVLEVRSPDEAAVMDRTLMAFPYDLIPSGSRVLLLGEAGGANVWLAARHEPASIHMVQPDPNLVELVRAGLRGFGGEVLTWPGVHVETTEPRHFVSHTPLRFDLIQLVGIESSAAGSGGLGGLGQDHLITLEGVTACLCRLSDDGLLSATRGIQSPPRDNLRLLATFVAALERIGVTTPERHIVIVRDYLAVCTIVKASPWTAEQIERVRRLCRRKELTPVWFSGIQPDELNHPDALEGPDDAPGDWYHHAATELFSERAEAFLDAWPFAIRSPTDDRPFFLDFCKLRFIGQLRRAFGDLWLTRTEIAFLFVLAAIVIVGVVAMVSTLLPLLLFRRRRRRAGWPAVVGYFGAIGLAYLLLEMSFLSRTTLWIGDPVIAATVTISGFLLFSGLGSLTAQRLGRDAGPWLRRIIVCLIVLGALELAVAGRLMQIVGQLPYVARCAGALLAVAPLGYLMGFVMPLALARLSRGARWLIPWAWGINGFASVLAVPLATALGMTWGFNVVAALALLLYVMPTVLYVKLPRERGHSTSSRRQPCPA